MDRHRLAEERSIALHREVAARLRADATLVDAARVRVDGWLATGDVHEHYARGWRDLLDRPLDELCAFLVDPGEHARAMRQCTPFAGVVDPRTRWRIWREEAERLGMASA
jgi:hypothetical protein